MRLRRALAQILALAAAGFSTIGVAQQGRIDRLPEAPVLARSASSDAELVRLARDITDPVVWAERVFSAGRPELRPSRMISLHRQGVPAGHLDALFEREARAVEADCAERVAARDRQQAQRHEEDLRRLEQVRPICPPAPFYPYPPYPPYPYPGYYWR